MAALCLRETYKQRLVAERVLFGELCSSKRYRPLESDMLEAEVYRLGFCRFIRGILQSLRSRRLSESALSLQTEQNVRSVFGLSGHSLSRSLLGGDTVVNSHLLYQLSYRG